MAQMISASRISATFSALTLVTAGLAGCGAEVDMDGRRAAAQDLMAGDRAFEEPEVETPATPVTPAMPATPAAPLEPPTNGVTCGLTPPPDDGLLLDMVEYNFRGDGAWGDTVAGHITGGTSPYSCADDGTCEATATPVRELAGSVLNVKASIPIGGYSGMVLWFTPCLDPSTFDGLSMMIGGNLAGSRLLVKPQAHVNYPVDLPNNKGGCVYTAEATKWSECVPPEFAVTEVQPEVSELQFRWSDFTGGVPAQDPPLDPATGLVGLELQWQCPADAAAGCELDVNLGTIGFIPPA